VPENQTAIKGLLGNSCYFSVLLWNQSSRLQTPTGQKFVSDFCHICTPRHGRLYRYPCRSRLSYNEYMDQ